MKLIAEVKTHSPFGYKSSKSWDELFEIANEVGNIISIHTDSRWHGSFELIRKARGLTGKPILAKGIHSMDDDVKKALDAGADYVLVVGRTPKVHLEKCLVEPNSLKELQNLPKSIKAVWNSRDLKTGNLKEASFQEARANFSGWLCQASNIAKLDDIDKTSDAVLVGTHLPQIADELRKSKTFKN